MENNETSTTKLNEQEVVQVIEVHDFMDRIFYRPVKRFRWFRGWFIPFYAVMKPYMMYGLLGIGTVLIATYGYLFLIAMGWRIVYANAASWVIATLFAFLTNRRWVFINRAKGVVSFWAQMGGFFFGRLFTVAIESVILVVFIAYLEFPHGIVKFLAQVVSIVLNYFISKYLVFRRRKKRM